MNDFKDVIKCPLCCSHLRKPEFTKDIFTGFRCSECGLVYISPVKNDIKAVYTDNRSSSPSEYYRLTENADVDTFTERIKIIEGLIPLGSLLDVGCSTGNFMRIAGKRGWKTMGIEPNPQSYNICIEKKLNVINTFLDKEFAGKYCCAFDAVYAGDVIEHVDNPVEFTSLLMNTLKPGGILLIVTPDYNSRIARYFQVKPVEHLLYFEKASLSFLFKKLNKNLELITTTTRERSIEALKYSTTFSSTKYPKMLVNILAFLKIGFIVNKIIKIFVRDEIISAARN